MAISSRGLVHSWYADGTMSVGTPEDLDAYETRTPYSVAAGQAPETIVAVAVVSFRTIDRVFTLYDDGSFSAGTPEELAAPNAPRGSMPLPPDLSARGVVGMDGDDAMRLHTWCDDGMFSVSSGENVEAIVSRAHFSVAAGKAPHDIVGVATDKADGTVYTWYSDRTFSVGNDGDLDAHRTGRYTIDEVDQRTAQVRVTGQGRASEITYDVCGGIAYLHGDIELGPAGEPDRWWSPPPHCRLPEGVQGLDRGFSTAELYRARADRWWGGIIPYEIREGDFSPAERRIIERAIDTLIRETNLSIVPRRAEPDHVVFAFPARAGVGGTSALGRTGGRQFIRLNRGFDEHTVMHEVLHAAGMWHEHSRTDRERHIEVLEENIEPEFRGAFAIVEAARVAPLPYDLRSVMHYRGYSFALRDEDGTPLPTIVDRRTDAPLHFRRELTRLDVRRANAMYPDALAAKDHLLVARADGEIDVWSWSTGRKVFIPTGYPFPSSWRPGDAIFTGDMLGNAREEIIIVTGDGHVDVMEFAMNEAPVSCYRSRVRRAPAEGVFVADVVGHHPCEILVAGQAEITIWCLWGNKLDELTRPLALSSEGALIGIGRLRGKPKADILCRERNGQGTELFIQHVGQLQRTPSSPIEFDNADGLLRGDFLGDERAEVLVFDSSTGRAAVFEQAHERWARRALLEWEPAARVAIGDLMGDDRDEIVLVHPGPGRVQVLAWNGTRFDEATAPFTIELDPASAIACGLRGYRP